MELQQMLSVLQWKPELFTEDKVLLGDIPPGSVDGCVFESVKPLEKMTRFEVKFNENESMKFLCTLEDHDF